MGRLLIIGCGGVAGVAIHKCCQNSKTFSEICIASRTKEKCDTLKKKLEATTDTKITTAQVNADKVEELVALIRSYQPDAVLNVALPYQDLRSWRLAWSVRWIISIPRITNRKIRMIRSGEPSMKNDAKRLDLLHILIIPGSGRIVKDSKKRGLQLSWEADLIRA